MGGFNRQSQTGNRTVSARLVVLELEPRQPVSDIVVGYLTTSAALDARSVLLVRDAVDARSTQIADGISIAGIVAESSLVTDDCPFGPSQVEGYSFHSNIVNSFENLDELDSPNALPSSPVRRMRDTASRLIAHEVRQSTPFVALPRTAMALNVSDTRLNDSALGLRRQRSPVAPVKATLQPKSLAAPIFFEVNRGQTDARVDFVARSSGYTLYLTPAEAVMTLRSQDAAAALRMQLLGADAQAKPEGLQQLPGNVNYYNGSDPSQWHVQVPTYSRVEYDDVYPGIDIAYYDNKGELEYDFIVEAGADPAPIHIKFAGAERLTINDRGDLIATTPAGNIVQPRPFIYQDRGESRVEVPSAFRLDSNGDPTVRFDIGAYDSSLPLVIDPKVRYQVLLGGSLRDESFAVSMNASAQATITGFTESLDFPTQIPWQPDNAGQRDVFITQLSADGTSLNYSTYLGGTLRDEGRGISVDANGFVAVTGFTESTNFPSVNALQPTIGGVRDAFVTKLNTVGQVVYSSYFGGPGREEGRGIATGPNNEVAVTGITSSPFNTFPLVNPVQGAFSGGATDAFVSKFRLQTGGNNLLFSSYLGGEQSENIDFDRESGGVAIDPLGAVYVTGATASFTFPVTFGAFQTLLLGSQDAFITKVTSTGVPLAYSTYLGGTKSESGNGIGVDQTLRAVITGTTDSLNLPTQVPFQGTLSGLSDAFVSSIGSLGNSLNFSTYLGGSNSTVGEKGFAISVQPDGAAYITGSTSSTDFPKKNALQQTYGGGQSDAFVSKFLNSGELRYSTFLGNNFTEYGRGIAWAPSPGRSVESCRRPDAVAGRDDPCTIAAITGPTDQGDIDGSAFATRVDECPCTPSDVTATSKPNGQIVLTWTDYCPDYTTQFIIHWWIEGETEEQPPISVDPGPPPLTFNHSGLDPNKNYQYKIISENTCCESDYSDQVSGSPGPNRPSVPADGGLDTP